jgi:hypothetical protein
MDGGMAPDALDVLDRIQAQVNAQISESLREQTTDKCFRTYAG